MEILRRIAARRGENLERFSVDRAQFDGSKSARSARRGAQRDAGASGKRRNAAEGPICPTAGRVLSRAGVVARRFRRPRIAMRRAPSVPSSKFKTVNFGVNGPLTFESSALPQKFAL
jgi:hypothetical protein